MTTVERPRRGSLTVGPLRPVILGCAAPAAAMRACLFSFNLIDSIWVGRLLGPAALAAVSTAGFYVWVLLSLGEMVEVGLIAVAARRHGEGFPEAAARAAAAVVQYALLAGAVVSIAGFALTDWLFRAMTVPAEVARLGHQYLRTWLLGGPLVFGFFAVEATFRASGDTRTPFRLLAASVLLSIGLDPLLIAGVGPFPRLGVEGAALASVMVRGGGFLIGGFIAISGFALSASALVGQNLGARQEARARQGVRMTVGYCLVVTTVTAVAFLTIPRTLVALFTSDPAVIADGSLYLRVIAFAQLGQTFEITLEGALAGAGYTLWPQLTSTSLTLLRVPLAAWWSSAIGVLGIWLALSVTAICRGIAMTLFWLMGAWRRATEIGRASCRERG